MYRFGSVRWRELSPASIASGRLCEQNHRYSGFSSFPGVFLCLSPAKNPVFHIVFPYRVLQSLFQFLSLLSSNQGKKLVPKVGLELVCASSKRPFHIAFPYRFSHLNYCLSLAVFVSIEPIFHHGNRGLSCRPKRVLRYPGWRVAVFLPRRTA